MFVIYRSKLVEDGLRMVWASTHGGGTADTSHAYVLGFYSILAALKDLRMVWGWLRKSSTILKQLIHACILQYKPVEDGLRIGKIRLQWKSMPCICDCFWQYSGGLEVTCVCALMFCLRSAARCRWPFCREGFWGFGQHNIVMSALANAIVNHVANPGLQKELE